MIFRFGRKQLSDVVKIQQFLEKENIEFELLLDHVDVQVGDEGASLRAAATPSVPLPSAAAAQAAATAAEYDPEWVPAKHDGKVCSDKSCRAAYHYFAEVIE